jgi:aldehyde dehydrogenase (NAD+)
VFGLTLNSGQTCIAPRRVFADTKTLAELTPKLARALDGLDPLPLDPARAPALREAVQDALTHGAHRVAGSFVGERQIVPICLGDVRPEMELARIDVFAPLVMLLAAETPDQALAASAVCPYALGATVFGPEPAARQFAARVRACVVVINDMIAPTGDPRLPFGGRGESGYGVTRGAEGLLELTRPKVVIHRRGRFRPHLVPVANEAELAEAYLQATHAGRWRLRLAGWGRLLRALVASRAPSSSSPARSVHDV